MRPKQRIKPFLKYIEEKWIDSPDQRFGQLLINLGIVEDGQFTWNAEIKDYNLPHKEMRKIQCWETYGKDGKSYKIIPIKDLEYNHIIKILETQSHISKKLRTFLEVEMSWRLSNG